MNPLASDEGCGNSENSKFLLTLEKEKAPLTA